ncbi:MAG: chemotaxis protein CheB, partial [Desulfurivibrionaceae bacterium]|nr:chemotaxis protein CheB [Desulfurivibrionaceae bacterium]
MPKDEKTDVDKELPVAGIGASAGYLEALQKFIDNLPEKSGAAYVVIVHLDPHHSSLLPELLQRRTAVPVTAIRDGMRLEADHIFVAPPNFDVSLVKSTFQLLPPVKTGGLRLPIDSFLGFLATEKKGGAACVILSGTGSDGTMGLRAIKDAGGLVLVQDQDSARFSGMPSSAINTGLVDLILAPERMPEELLRYFQTRVRISGSTPDAAGDNNLLQKIWAVLQARTGEDFSAYKKKTILRRFERRMKLNHLEEPGQYIRLLRQSDLEVDKLFRDILIGVTSFFRDSQAFEALKRELAEKVLPGLSLKQPLRVWVPGCSGGEEVYSLAILIREGLDAEGGGRHFQIFGTDLDESA